MKLYKLSWQDHHQGFLATWHPSKDAAEKALREQKRDAIEAQKAMQKWQESDMEGEEPRSNDTAVDTLTIFAVDFPTTKDKIIEWLNTHCGENG